MEIALVVEPGTTGEVALTVRQSASQYTRIGYDQRRQVLFVDRSFSGNALLRDTLPARHEAPLKPDATGAISLTVYVDRSSVEVFGNDGRVVLTDIILTDEDGLDIQLYSEGGSAQLRSLQAWPLRQSFSATARLNHPL
jgi:fructan beta-fructosidase